MIFILILKQEIGKIGYN